MPPPSDAVVHGVSGGGHGAGGGPGGEDAGEGRTAPSRRPEPVMTRRAVLRRLPARTRRLLRRHELPLTAAGLTFYGALAAVPSVLIAIRVAGWLVGDDRMRDLGATLQAALPSAMGADVVARAAVVYGLGVAWPVVVFSLFPASLYGEGLRRAYAALGDGGREARTADHVDEGHRSSSSAGAHQREEGQGGSRRGEGLRRRLRRLTGGWRARGALLPVLAAAPLLLLVVLGVTPLIADLVARGVDGTALGVYVSLNVDWVVISLPLAWSFHAVAPQHLAWPAALAGGFSTGAFVAGFVQGIVLFVALPVDVGAPFGGSPTVGGIIAALLWLWLLHVVVLVGFAASLCAVALRRGR